MLPFQKLLPFCLLPFFLSLSLEAQDQDQGQDDAVFRVEIREVSPRGSNGVLDSLDRKFFFHTNGKAYKHFGLYEAAVAHFRKESYHPRDQVETVKGVVYISDFSEELFSELPRAFKVRKREGELNKVTPIE